MRPYRCNYCARSYKSRQSMKEHEYQCPYKSDPVQPAPGKLQLKKNAFFIFSLDFSNFHAELAQKSLLNGPRPPTSQPSPLLPQPGSNPGMGPNPADLRNIYERNMREMQLNLLRATNPALAAAANLHNPLPNPLSLPALQQRAQLPHGLRPPFSIPQLNPALHSQVTVSSIFLK